MNRSPSINGFCSYRWYGFDLDGTIADNTHHGSGTGLIGKPIKPMISLMQKLHRRGCRVKIVTARLNDLGDSVSEQNRVKRHIWAWCDKNIGFRPEITDRKDGSMECLYDDRARQIVRNMGINMEDVAIGLAHTLDGLIESPRRNLKKAISVRNRCRAIGIL